MTKLTPARTKLKYLVTTVFLILIVGYGLYQTRDLISRPQIIVDAPENGSTSTTSLITIAGRTKQVIKLFLNGEKLTPDRLGRFESQLLLAPGYNIIQLNGEDRFGRRVEKKLELVLLN